MIDHVKTLLAVRPVDGGDINDGDELAGRIVSQKGCDLDDVGAFTSTVSSPNAT